MPAYVRVNPGDPMQAARLNQVIDSLTGAVGKGVPLAVTAVNDASNYALAIQNDDATNSRALLVQKQDGTTLIQADVNGVVLALANGSVHNAALASDVARANLLTNGGFEVSQRTGPFSVSGAWTADRWQLVLVGAPAVGVTRITSTAGSPGFSLDLAQNSTAGNYIYLQQPLPDLLPQLAGKTVTFAMTCKGSGTTSAGVYRLAIYTNVGGRTYSAYNTTASGVERLTVTAPIASNATVLAIEIDLDGAVATGQHVEINDAMLVVGSQPSDYVPLHPADDLARCLRYYELYGVPGSGDLLFGSMANAGGAYYFTYPHRAEKPVSPTITVVGTWAYTNSSGLVTNGGGTKTTRFGMAATTAGTFYAVNSNAGNTISIESNPLFIPVGLLMMQWAQPDYVICGIALVAAWMVSMNAERAAHLARQLRQFPGLDRLINRLWRPSTTV